MPNRNELNQRKTRVFSNGGNPIDYGINAKKRELAEGRKKFTRRQLVEAKRHILRMRNKTTHDA